MSLDLPAGSIVKFLVGFYNKGFKDFTIETLEASFRYPQDYSFYINNVCYLTKKHLRYYCMISIICQQIVLNITIKSVYNLIYYSLMSLIYTNTVSKINMHAFQVLLHHTHLTFQYTAAQFDRVVEPGHESTFDYAFMPSDTYAGRPLGLVVNIRYSDVVSSTHLPCI